MDCTSRSLENWRKQAVEQGPASLLERTPHPPQVPTLDGEGEARLVALAECGSHAMFDAVVEQAVTRDLRNGVYRHLLDLDLRFFGRTRAGQVISRLTNDVELLRTLVTRNISKFVTSVLEVIAGNVGMHQRTAPLPVFGRGLGVDHQRVGLRTL